ncbi:MAG: ribonuclease E/G, partial [Acidobacteriota bacterium]|nr:ribonuclease E/G [Acidobacteriota bacterium]
MAVAPEILASASVHKHRGPQEEAHPSRDGSGRSSPLEAADRPTRAPRVPAPFVLPGESLSKYGGAPADEASKAAQKVSAPVRPVGTSRPSTLIEKPIEWDGSGLLPGESLSGRRARQPEPEITSEPHLETELEPDVPISETMEAGVGEEFPEEQAVIEETQEDYLAEETREFDPGSTMEFEVSSAAARPEHEEPSTDELAEAPAIGETASAAGSEAVSDSEAASIESEEPEPGASASHRIDPVPPTGFRLFGLGGKKKKEEEGAPGEKPKVAATTAVSAFAPGSGIVEEEVIEGEESETVPPPHRHPKADEHDLDDYEEQTLSTQIRSGDLGEMFQEAHLDHRIQLNFDEKNGEDEEALEGEEEEGPTAEAQPASGQPRRERGGRGRRGRGGLAAPAQAGRRGPSRRSMQTTDLPVISDLLKPGQEILVQIAKEPIAKKGARITSHIALPGRFLVFMPTVTHVGVSRKIASDEERQRMKRILINERGEASGGFIVRTAAEGASEEELRADLRFLIRLWNDIKQRSDSSKSPALIYHDLSLIERILRDQVSADFSNIWVDSEADYERIVRFLNRFSPSLVRRVKLFTKETPLFEHFGIQDEISKALRSKVWLKSGGSIVINQTEALVAIDINTGKYVGKSARLEDTIVKTNLDAVPEIVRQIRLR